MLLSGNLSNWSVSDLLNMMRVTGKTATLRIEGTRAGVVHFDDGRIVGAALAGVRSSPRHEDAVRSTVDALYVLSGATEGSFLVGDPEMQPGSPGWDVSELMSEVLRLRMIEEDVFRQGVGERTLLTLTPDVPSPVTLHAEEWAALVSLVPSFTLAALEPMIGRAYALQIINTLLVRGLTVKGPEELTKRREPEPEPAALPTQQHEPEVVVEPDRSTPELEEPEPEVEDEEQEPPVLDWLSDRPAGADVDLSTSFRNDQEEGDTGTTRRSLKSVAASAETTLVSGVLGDMRKLRTGNG
ncbi:MAG: DUF4388 domain-containing protein [Actinomycetota bacterium]